ncbi:MAG TPA: hypothetical protein IAA06_00155 [Candidatus Blautia faecavium]|uniref:Uncharacterized protein n=1 Tax=Candidatus Blautia faecavium TaxID=2838487 RepID=A0A9D2LPZ9_9FIRM|nr:hypothetical protein [Candidatus Blautia faecavium]
MDLYITHIAYLHVLDKGTLESIMGHGHQILLFYGADTALVPDILDHVSAGRIRIKRMPFALERSIPIIAFEIGRIVGGDSRIILWGDNRMQEVYTLLIKYDSHLVGKVFFKRTAVPVTLMSAQAPDTQNIRNEGKKEAGKKTVEAGIKGKAEERKNMDKTDGRKKANAGKDTNSKPGKKEGKRNEVIKTGEESQNQGKKAVKKKNAGPPKKENAEGRPALKQLKKEREEKDRAGQEAMESFAAFDDILDEAIPRDGFFGSDGFINFEATRKRLDVLAGEIVDDHLEDIGLGTWAGAAGNAGSDPRSKQDQNIRDDIQKTETEEKKIQEEKKVPEEKKDPEEKKSPAAKQAAASKQEKKEGNAGRNPDEKQSKPGAQAPKKNKKQHEENYKKLDITFNDVLNEICQEPVNETHSRAVMMSILKTTECTSTEAAREIYKDNLYKFLPEKKAKFFWAHTETRFEELVAYFKN